MRPVGEQREDAGRRAHPLRHAQEPRASSSPKASFREDLFYRINVIELRVPALRERAEDIPELADAILRRLSRRTGHGRAGARRPRRSTCCESFTFPGQRARARERARARADAVRRRHDRRRQTCSCAPCRARRTRRHSPDAGAAARASRTRGRDRVARRSASSSKTSSAPRSSRRWKQTRYNKTAAAKLLGMSFRALRYRIKKLGIE